MDKLWGYCIMAALLLLFLVPSGCLNAAQNDRIAALETRVEEATKKFESGELTSAEFKDLVKDVRTEIGDIKDSGARWWEIAASIVGVAALRFFGIPGFRSSSGPNVANTLGGLLATAKKKK